MTVYIKNLLNEMKWNKNVTFSISSRVKRVTFPYFFFAFFFAFFFFFNKILLLRKEYGSGIRECLEMLFGIVDTYADVL